MPTNAEFNALNAITEISNQFEEYGDIMVALCKQVLPGKTMHTTMYDGKYSSKFIFHFSDLVFCIDRLASFLRLTPQQTVIFIGAYAFQVLKNRAFDTNDIAKQLGVSTIDILPLKKEYDYLIRKAYFRESAWHLDHCSYKVSPAIEEALAANKRIDYSFHPEIDRYQFCNKISIMLKNRAAQAITTDKMFELADEAERDYRNLEFIQETQKLLTNLKDRVIFYRLCNDYINAQQAHQSNIDAILADLYNNISERLTVKQSLIQKTNDLVSKKLISIQAAANPTGEAFASLTTKGQRIFLEDNFEFYKCKVC